MEKMMKLAAKRAQKRWHRTAVAEAGRSMMVQKHWVMEQAKLPRERHMNLRYFQPWFDLPTMTDYSLPVVPVLPLMVDYILLVVPVLPLMVD